MTYEEIGRKCNPPVTRRQIFRDRQSIELKQFYNDLYDECMADLAKLRDFGDSKDKRFALSQKMKFLTALTRAIIPTKIEQKIEGEIRTYDVEALLKRVVEQRKILENNR